MTTSVYTFDITTDPATIAANYVAADTGEKARMRVAIGHDIDAAVRATDFGAATVLVGFRDVMVAPKSTVSGPDYVAAIADRRADLVAAIAAIDAGNFTLPEGVSLPDGDHDFTGGTTDPKSVARFATIGGRKSGRGDVAGYVDSVLGDDPMTIKDMRAAWVASEDYPKAPPSHGAIAAMLDRDGGAEVGITVCDIDGVKGAQRDM